MRRAFGATLVAAAALAAASAAMAEQAAPLAKRISETRKDVRNDVWHGHDRVVFDFDGRQAWIVLPKGEPAEGAPWTWTMQWADAFVDRQGCLGTLARGWRHVTIDVFGTRMDAEGLRVCRAFQRYLVETLGFAPQARLIGMSWGGFFSVRYANAHPDCVRRIYLDAPLLHFGSGFARGGAHSDASDTLGPWAASAPADGNWLDDPRMPVNMAGSLARAKIPVLLLYGGQDQSVVPETNCELFASRFKAAGGDISVNARTAFGHHPHGLDPDKTGPIVDFFLETPAKAGE